MKIAIILSLVTILGLCAVAQEARPPEVRLRIVLEKNEYALNDQVLARAELTNLTSKTLCFPVPAQDCRVTATGSVLTTGEPLPVREDHDLFICQACGGSWAGKQLESAIREKWIKLPPNGVYTMPLVEVQVSLIEAGQWRLMSTYRPPEAAFGDVRAYRRRMQSTANKVGCTVPELNAVAEPVLVTVSAVDQRK